MSAVNAGMAARTGMSAMVSFSWGFQDHRLVNVVSMRLLSADVRFARQGSGDGRQPVARYSLPLQANATSASLSGRVIRPSSVTISDAQGPRTFEMIVSWDGDSTIRK